MLWPITNNIVLEFTAPGAIEPEKFNRLFEETCREAVDEYKIRLADALKRYQNQYQ